MDLPERVVWCAPEGEVAEAREVIVVHAGAAPSPCLVPAPERGSWRRVGPRAWVFEADERLPMATRYTVESADARWHFATPPPKLVERRPTGASGGVPPDGPLTLVFDQRVTAAALPLRMDGHTLTVTARSACSVEVGFWPPLPVDGQATLVIPRGTPSAEGPRRTAADQSYTLFAEPEEAAPAPRAPGPRSPVPTRAGVARLGGTWRVVGVAAGAPFSLRDARGAWLDRGVAGVDGAVAQVPARAGADRFVLTVGGREYTPAAVEADLEPRRPPSPRRWWRWRAARGSDARFVEHACAVLRDPHAETACDVAARALVDLDPVDVARLWRWQREDGSFGAGVEADVLAAQALERAHRHGLTGPPGTWRPRADQMRRAPGPWARWVWDAMHQRAGAPPPLDELRGPGDLARAALFEPDRWTLDARAQWPEADLDEGVGVARTIARDGDVWRISLAVVVTREAALTLVEPLPTGLVPRFDAVPRWQLAGGRPTVDGWQLSLRGDRLEASARLRPGLHQLAYVADVVDQARTEAPPPTAVTVDGRRGCA